MTEDVPNSRSRSSWPIVVVGLLMVFVVYPLSIGPAVWVVLKTQSEPLAMVLIYVYQPVTHLVSLNETLAEISQMESEPTTPAVS